MGQALSGRARRCEELRAEPGDARWTEFDSPFTRDFFAAPSDSVSRVLRLRAAVTYSAMTAKGSNQVDQVEKALCVLAADSRSCASAETHPVG